MCLVIWKGEEVPNSMAAQGPSWTCNAGLDPGSPGEAEEKSSIGSRTQIPAPDWGPCGQCPPAAEAPHGVQPPKPLPCEEMNISPGLGPKSAPSTLPTLPRVSKQGKRHPPNSHSYPCSPMFIAAVLTTAKLQKQPYN
jgi:hypothetical protein